MSREGLLPFTILPLFGGVADERSRALLEYWQAGLGNAKLHAAGAERPFELCGSASLRELMSMITPAQRGVHGVLYVQKCRYVTKVPTWRRIGGMSVECS